MKIDLHVHSTYSDGGFTPEQVIKTAIDLDITAISITDHDNVLSYKIAKDFADRQKQETGKEIIEIIPGVEINTMWNNDEIHILGYYANENSKEFQDLLSYQQHARIDQTMKIIKNLNKKAHIDISFEHISSLVAKGGSIGRPHIAKAIVNAGGTNSVMESYEKYINDNSPVYVKRNTVSPHEAVEIIYECGGIPVIAHPCDIEKPENLIKDLMNYGLRGIEAYHRKHSPPMVEYYSSIAEKFDLIVTGGSDFHAPLMNGNIIMGRNLVPTWILDGLKKEKNRIAIAEM